MYMNKHLFNPSTKRKILNKNWFNMSKETKMQLTLNIIFKTLHISRVTRNNY